jgi:hypothetical protein
VDSKGRIWFYGSLEVSFFDGVSKMIAVALWDPPVKFPPPLVVELGPLAPGARIEAVRDALDAEGIACTLDESRSFDDGAVLVVGSCVEITFHDGRLDEMIASAV